MFRKILVICFLCFFIFSCWSEETNTQTWLIKQETQNISIDIPSNWEVISDKENILPKAKDGEIELAVTSKNAVNWFANNMLILSDDLQKYVSSKEFAMLNNIWAQTDYLDYTSIESKDFKFSDWEASMLYVFEAKYNIDTPKLKFMQTAHICNQNKAYYITIALPTSVTDTAKYEEFLASMACK